MIKFELLRDRGILILSPDGPLEKPTLNDLPKRSIRSLPRMEG